VIKNEKSCIGQAPSLTEPISCYFYYYYYYLLRRSIDRRRSGLHVSVPVRAHRYRRNAQRHRLSAADWWSRDRTYDSPVNKNIATRIKSWSACRANLIKSFAVLTLRASRYVSDRGWQVNRAFPSRERSSRPRGCLREDLNAAIVQTC